MKTCHPTSQLLPYQAFNIDNIPPKIGDVTFSSDFYEDVDNSYVGGVPRITEAGRVLGEELAKVVEPPRLSEVVKIVESALDAQGLDQMSDELSSWFTLAAVEAAVPIIQQRKKQ